MSIHPPERVPGVGLLGGRTSSSSSSRSQPNTLRRMHTPRTVFTPTQLAGLERIYASSPKPERENRKILSEALHLSDTVVRIWFQNRRCKERRSRKEEEAERLWKASARDISQTRRRNMSSSPVNNDVTSPVGHIGSSAGNKRQSPADKSTGLSSTSSLSSSSSDNVVSSAEENLVFLRSNAPAGTRSKHTTSVCERLEGRTNRNTSTSQSAQKSITSPVSQVSWKGSEHRSQHTSPSIAIRSGHVLSSPTGGGPLHPDQHSSSIHSPSTHPHRPAAILPGHLNMVPYFTAPTPVLKTRNAAPIHHTLSNRLLLPARNGNHKAPPASRSKLSKFSPASSDSLPHNPTLVSPSRSPLSVSACRARASNPSVLTHPITMADPHTRSAWLKFEQHARILQENIKLYPLSHCQSMDLDDSFSLTPGRCTPPLTSSPKPLPTLVYFQSLEVEFERLSSIAREITASFLQSSLPPKKQTCASRPESPVGHCRRVSVIVS